MIAGANVAHRYAIVRSSSIQDLWQASNNGENGVATIGCKEHRPVRQKKMDLQHLVATKDESSCPGPQHSEAEMNASVHRGNGVLGRDWGSPELPILFC